MTILVCDDEPSVLLLTARILRNGGYTVLPAMTTAEAIQRAEGQTIDLLVTDQVMPQNGKRIAEVLRAAKPELPVIFMSGYNAPVPEQKGRTASIGKPFQSGVLLGLVARMLAEV